jgi:2,4-diketo-3-deoxy-L-fuconate hydrolase
VFPVPVLVAELSRVVTLEPGDVIFTGTPGGVGLARKPPVFLAPGDELVTTVQGIGELRHRFVSA